MKKCCYILGLLLIFITLIVTLYLENNDIILCFEKIEKISINDSFIKKENDNSFEDIYEAEILNSAKFNLVDLSFKNGKNKIIKTKIKKLTKDNFLKIYSIRDKKLYKIRTLPLDFPEYKLTLKEWYTKGYLFTSLRSPIWNFEAQQRNSDLVGNVSPNSFAFCINLEKNEIVFYGKSRGNITNLQKNVTETGKVYFFYSIDTSEIDDTFCPLCYSRGYLLDKNFQIIKTINSYQKDDFDQHFFCFIDENHYIINAFSITNNYFEPFKKNMECIHSVIQEIKNDKLLLEENLDLFYEKFEQFNLWNKPNNESVLLSHVNSVIVDPTDNNLIVSCAVISSIIKIERTTGKILWILGGREDNFGLAPSEKPIMQHALSISKDGYLTLLNNNHIFWINEEHYKDFHPGTAEILQFKLDEKNFKITGFRKYSINDLITAQGSAYEVANNRFLIAYGTEAATENGKGLIISEIDVSENKKYMQITLPADSKYDCYNAYLYKTLD